jgi:hypothetical protein
MLCNLCSSICHPLYALIVLLNLIKVFIITKRKYRCISSIEGATGDKQLKADFLWV